MIKLLQIFFIIIFIILFVIWVEFSTTLFLKPDQISKFVGYSILSVGMCFIYFIFPFIVKFFKK